MYTIYNWYFGESKVKKIVLHNTIFNYLKILMLFIFLPHKYINKNCILGKKLENRIKVPCTLYLISTRIKKKKNVKIMNFTITI